MTVSANDILKVVAVMVFTDGNIMQNVFSLLISGAGGPFDDEDVIDDCEDYLDDIYANLVTMMTDEVDGSELRVYKYDAVDEDYDEVGAEAWAFNPNNAGQQLPRGVAALINARTTDPDVSGKKYFGGIGENFHGDGVWDGEMLTALALASVDWLTAFVGVASGADFTPGVWSPKNLTFHPMSGEGTIPTIASYQRRRKQGVGI